MNQQKIKGVIGGEGKGRERGEEREGEGEEGKGGEGRREEERRGGSQEKNKKENEVTSQGFKEERSYTFLSSLILEPIS